MSKGPSPMRSPLRSHSALTLPLLLLMTCGVAGCLTTQSTIPTAETSLVREVCRAWPVVTYSSKDTAESQREIRASNAARLAFGCK